MLTMPSIYAVQKGVKKAGKCWNYKAKAAGNECGVCSKSGFQCSREKGHKGKHHAHTMTDLHLESWKGGKVK